MVQPQGLEMGGAEEANQMGSHREVIHFLRDKTPIVGHLRASRSHDYDCHDFVATKYGILIYLSPM